MVGREGTSYASEQLLQSAEFEECHYSSTTTEYEQVV